MDISQNLDSLISKYCSDLMEMKEKWSKWGIETENPTETPKEQEEKATDELNLEDALLIDNEQENSMLEPTESDSPNIAEAEKPEKEAEAEPIETKIDEANEITSEAPVANPQNYATFSARVFSGEEAYPVENAKVMLYIGKTLYSFLITDENGETPKIKIEAPPEKNSLVPNSENQQLDYSADVFAEGFTTARGLLVSAVGSSDILLPVRLAPLSERID